MLLVLSDGVVVMLVFENARTTYKQVTNENEMM